MSEPQLCFAAGVFAAIAAGFILFLMLSGILWLFIPPPNRWMQ